MAVIPLFVASMTALTASLRLESAANAQPLIDKAVQQVRIGFYDSLGDVLVGQILAMAYSDNPATPSERTRMRACNIETAWVRMHLLRSMPVLFQDASSKIPQAWNEEGMYRSLGAAEIGKEILRLQSEVNEGLAILVGSDEAGETVSAATIGPTCPAEAPGTGMYYGRQVPLSLDRRVSIL